MSQDTLTHPSTATSITASNQPISYSSQPIDDIKGIGFHEPHFDLLLTTLQQRYGSEVAFDYNFTKYAGQQYHTQSDGGLTIDSSQYIREMLLSFGIQDVEGASTLTSPDFFQVTTDPTRSM